MNKKSACVQIRNIVKEFHANLSEHWKTVKQRGIARHPFEWKNEIVVGKGFPLTTSCVLGRPAFFLASLIRASDSRLI